jgi:Icc-related predicted phosphoesterase
MLDMLNVPMLFVHGNHDPEQEITHHGTRRYPWGATNLDQKFIWFKGLIFFGLEGCVRYSKGEHQYTQTEMWFKVLRAVPRLIYNRIRHGRALDVFVTHSPSRDLGDAEDPAHQGFVSYRWFLKVFKPRYHIHGHIHIYDRNDFKPRLFEETIILNTCSYQRLEINLPQEDKDE